jgi:hypothetical protein
VYTAPDDLEWISGYTSDCWSQADEWGYRRSNMDPVEWLPGEKPWHYVARVSRRVNEYSDRPSARYAEYHCNPTEPDAVWYSRHAGRIWYLRAKRIARSLGLPLISVD